LSNASAVLANAQHAASKAIGANFRIRSSTRFVIAIARCRGP